MIPFVHIDPVGGIAGDMFAAAMLDAFPELEPALHRDLSDSGVSQHIDLQVEEGRVGGFRGKRVAVVGRSDAAEPTRHYRHIRDLLSASGLDAPVKVRALDIVARLAAAEARVHGIPVDQVHFHEVADWDSVADIVAAASLAERSGATGWSCTSVPQGTGRVRTEHGLIPVPAPAVVELLRDFDVHTDGETGERVTPTGAAILRHLVARPGPAPSGTLRRAGVGLGTRTFAAVPNLLRLTVLESGRPTAGHDTVATLSFEVDDMTPEELSVALDRIRAGDGVLDASFQLRLGKKGRAQFAVEVLARNDAAEPVADLCFLETSTLGLRIGQAVRRVLHRETAEAVPQVKSADRPDGGVTSKAESDHLADMPTLRARREEAARLEKGSRNG